MSIEREADKLAGVAAKQNLGESLTFSVEPEFHGQEHRLIELANGILKARDDDEIQMEVCGVGVIGIQA